MRVSGPVRDQADLNRSERKLNLVGRMSIEGSAHSRLANRKVVLVDDIITTGSTVAEMARCLESEGIVPEIFVTFAETL
jgi:predicted amidophosphoribosyltransferase